MTHDLRAAFAKLPRWTLPIAGLTALFGLRPVAGWDIWWHLRTGEAAASLGSLLPTDPFSHTFAGQPWGHKDLGADLLLWAIHGLLGPPGLVLLRALLFALVVWVTLRGAARRGAAPWASALLVSLLVLATEFRFVPRPGLFSLTLLPCLLWLLAHQRATQRFRTGPWAALIAAFFALWANLHRGALLGLGVLLIHGALGARHKDRRWQHLLGALAGVFGTLCTPSGLRIFGKTTEVVAEASYRQQISEWAPPTLTLMSEELPWLLLLDLLLCLGLLLGSLKARQDKGPGPRVEELATCAFLLLTGLAGVRFLAYFPLGATVIAAQGWTRILAGRPRALLGRLPLLPHGIASSLLVFAALTHPYPTGWGLQTARYPSTALAFARAEGVQGPVFNSLIFGGYLIWHRIPVFVDGRNDQVYPVAFISEALDAKRSPSTFERLANEHQVQWLLIANQVGSPGFKYLAESPAWAPVHWSDVAVLYLKRDGPNRPLAEALAYQHVHPARPMASLGRALAEAAGNTQRIQAIDQELQRAVDQDPRSGRAAALQALFFHANADPRLPKAMQRLEQLAPEAGFTAEIRRRVSGSPPTQHEP